MTLKIQSTIPTNRGGGVISFSSNLAAASNVNVITGTTGADSINNTISGVVIDSGIPRLYASGVFQNDDTVISSGGNYTLGDETGTITINTTDAVTIEGSSDRYLNNVQILVATDNANLTIKNLNVINTAGNVIKFGNGANNRLFIEGKNNLVILDTDAAGINIGGGLTIDGSGYVFVRSSGGAGIGTDRNEENPSNIEILGSTVHVRAGGGAGIGSGFGSTAGNITISGDANVISSSHYGAGIGSGAFNGSIGDIFIGGNANITATSRGAGIGSGTMGDCSAGNILITDNARVVATASEGGAGIGCGGMESSVGNIIIGGKAYVIATCTETLSPGYAGGAIGGGSSWTHAGNVSIGGDATVKATSTDIGGVGIGTGSAGVLDNTIGIITIGGDTLTSAQSLVILNNDDESLREITINGGVYATENIVFVDGVMKHNKIK